MKNKLISRPPKESINGGLSPCSTSILVAKYGNPRALANVTTECQPPSLPFWKRRMITKDVGPFRLTGHKLFLATLEKAFAEIKREYPDVYEGLGTAGCLCIRWVRGSSSTLSNHSFGLAVDLTLYGELDRRGDNKVQEDLMKVYSVFKKYKIYWGAEFNIEDAMHFEASKELVAEWIAKGVF